MSLSPITSAPEIRQARQTMLATLRRGGQRHRSWIGWQGGSHEYDVTWNAGEGFWVRADESPYYGRWLIWFGTDDPTLTRMLTIVCEVNPPEAGVNRQCAGLFVRDMGGAIYITHSGKIGGGRHGIGKSAFLASYRGALEKVAWPDGKESEVIVIGRVDGERLAPQVSNFIREVQRFKASAVGSSARTVTSGQRPPPVFEPHFNQEFSGHRRGYRMSSEIETRCDHGLIINALPNALQAMGLRVANDQCRDLYIPGSGHTMNTLFEAKTDVTTSTIYQAIGQLLFHSATQAPRPKLVMVLPATPNTATKGVLERMGITVLVYGWRDHEPAFINLAGVSHSIR